MKNEPAVIRPYARTDIDFIMSSWLKSLKDDIDVSIKFENWKKLEKAIKHREDIPTLKAFTNNEKFYSMHHPLISMILQRAGAMVLCNPTDYDHIYGYICGEHIGRPGEELFVIHWVYIKNSFRQMGMADLLARRCNITKHKPLSTFRTLRAAMICPTHPFIYDEKLLGQIFSIDGKPIAETIKVKPERRK